MRSNRHHVTQPEPRIALGSTRRRLLGAPLAAAAAGVFAPAAFAVPSTNPRAQDVRLAPLYYPLKNVRPEVPLDGMLAVVTGASRGIGRAIAEALAALGVTVIGTSRQPASVPDPPAFPLLGLDVADPLSVLGFAAALHAHPAFLARGRLDILVNNAGRFVVGQIVPQPGTDPAWFRAQRDLAARTLYAGHVDVTTTLLPLLTSTGHARIVFTVSISAYYSGAAIDGASLIESYSGAKAALRVYAANLDALLRAAGSNIRVCTVNPYAVHTQGPVHPNPIYTQPVNDQGLSDTDPVFNQTMTFLRQVAANGLPPQLVGDACAQLLRMADPPLHVVVASPREPLATQGLNAVIEPAILADNAASAVPLVCGRG